MRNITALNHHHYQCLRRRLCRRDASAVDKPMRDSKGRLNKGCLYEWLLNHACGSVCNCSVYDNNNQRRIGLTTAAVAVAVVEITAALLTTLHIVVISFDVKLVSKRWRTVSTTTLQTGMIRYVVFVTITLSFIDESQIRRLARANFYFVQVYPLGYAQINVYNIIGHISDGRSGYDSRGWSPSRKTRLLQKRQPWSDQTKPSDKQEGHCGWWWKESKGLEKSWWR